MIKLFKEAIENNYSNRKDNVLDIIEEYLSLEDIATRMYKMQKEGKLPLRVTHNDTKCNNVLFDKDTRIIFSNQFFNDLGDKRLNDLYDLIKDGLVEKVDD